MNSNNRNPKNAGRKPIDKEARNVSVSIRLSEEEMREIEKIAKELDIPKTRFIRNLALVGLDNAKVLSATGVLKGTKKFIDFKERLLNPKKYQTLPSMD